MSFVIVHQLVILVINRMQNTECIGSTRYNIMNPPRARGGELHRPRARLDRVADAPARERVGPSGQHGANPLGLVEDLPLQGGGECNTLGADVCY